MSNYQEPISDLEYDLLTIVQSKAEAVRAYQKYLKDAQEANDQKCTQLFKRLLDEDTRHLKEARQHLQEVMSGRMGSGQGQGGSSPDQSTTGGMGELPA